MKKHEVLEFGFFFSGTCQKYSALFFTAFQLGESVLNAHQIVITEVRETSRPPQRVAFTINPETVKTLNSSVIETLCRVAVRQFLEKILKENFPVAVLPLEMSAPPWDGQVLLV